MQFLHIIFVIVATKRNFYTTKRNRNYLERLQNPSYLCSRKSNSTIIHHIKYDVSSSYIQNETIDYDAYYTNTPLSIGYDVDPGHPYGNVIVKAGHTLSIKRQAEINLNNGFSVEKGATFVIQ